MEHAHQLGFTLAGITTPDQPAHFALFENWLADSKHGTMTYLARPSARQRRADPRQILPECKSILVLAVPYSSPVPRKRKYADESTTHATTSSDIKGRIASYAWGQDYHKILPKRMKKLVEFIELQVGKQVPNRYYTDSGPILERDLAQRAGLGWIGKNTCLINPRQGSYFLLGEILLGIELEPDPPFTTDQCGTCTRCLDSCPTQCILPDRTLDARRCISYLTIELKEGIPSEFRHLLGQWVFGCDICQMICPWNRFASDEGDGAFTSSEFVSLPVLTEEISMDQEAFNQRYEHSPLKRAKHCGYLRNVAVAMGNLGTAACVPFLKKVMTNAGPLIRDHAEWAIQKIQNRNRETPDDKIAAGDK